MLKVIVPFVVMMIIILVKKIPYIGGKVSIALALAGAIALLMAGIYNPVSWLKAYLDGLNRLSWVIMIALFGSIYAKTQSALGTMDTVLDACRAALGRTPKGLYAAGFITLILFGSLLGEGLSAACVCGVLLVGPFIDLGLRTEKVSATLVMGALIGSLCPPMTNGIVLASSLAGADYETVLKWSFLTVPLVATIVVTLYTFSWIKIKSLPEHLIPNEKAGAILKKGFVSLIPMLVLVTVLILAYAPWNKTINTNIIKMIWSPFQSLVSKIPFIGSGFSNFIVVSLITVTAIAFLFKKTRKFGLKKCIVGGWKDYMPCGYVHLGCALMLGGFYAAGLIDAVSEWATRLNVNVLKAGGSAGFALLGMITGSQSTAQNVIMPFFAPALVATGMTAENVALAGSHLAMGAQAFPPVDLCTIVVAPLVAGIVGRECNYVKSMLYSLPGQMLLYLSGVLLLFVPLIK